MNELLFREQLHHGWSQSFGIEEVLFENKTEHQHLVIFRSETFGRVMALDGIIQTTERDEFIYHEMMAHVPLFAHASPQQVLIIGGGDGGMLREVVKHQRVEHVVQVEIDQAVIDMCTEFLPHHSAGAYDHPKAEVVVADGIDFVTRTDRRFDVIISDCTDPVGPGEVLFSSRFYQGVKHCLKPGGVFVAQNGVAFMQPEEVITTHQRLEPYFRDRWFYAAAVPTYVGGVMTFAWATDDTELRRQDTATLRQRFDAETVETRYYTPELHAAAFALPAYLVDELGG